MANMTPNVSTLRRITGPIPPRRRSSWPSPARKPSLDTIIESPPSDNSPSASEAGIDADPLAHFLTPPGFDSDSDDICFSSDSDYGLSDCGEDDDDDDELLSAGIEPPPTPPIRSISPSSLAQAPAKTVTAAAPTPIFAPADNDNDNANDIKEYITAADFLFSSPSPLPLSLSDFSAAHASRAHPRRPTKADASAGAAGPAASADTPRGRGRGRAHVRSRSLPSRIRPHSWREPSPHVWSILEEDEGDGEVVGKAERVERLEGDGDVAVQGHIEVKKVVKRVRFAE